MIAAFWAAPRPLRAVVAIVSVGSAVAAVFYGIRHVRTGRVERTTRRLTKAEKKAGRYDQILASRKDKKKRNRLTAYLSRRREHATDEEYRAHMIQRKAREEDARLRLARMMEGVPCDTGAAEEEEEPPFTLAIDFSFMEFQGEREVRSIKKQLQYVYGALKVGWLVARSPFSWSCP